MCWKCGKVRTHTGMLRNMLRKKLVSGSRTFWFSSPYENSALKEVGGVLKKI